MQQGVFNPILDHYKVKEEDKEYIFTFFTKGIISVVFRWIKNDCKEEIDTMINLIQHCVGRKSGLDWRNRKKQSTIIKHRYLISCADNCVFPMYKFRIYEILKCFSIRSIKILSSFYLYTWDLSFSH